MNDKYKDEIEIHTKSLRNPNVQKQFKDYYYDKDRMKSTASSRTTITTNN